MTVEYDTWARLQQAQKRDAGAELIDEKRCRCELSELIGEESDLQDEVHLTKDGAEDSEAAEESRRYDRCAAHANIEGTFCDGGQVSVTFSKHERRQEGTTAGQTYHRVPHRSSGSGRGRT